jgi:SAM-dependent methyltransferase
VGEVTYHAPDDVADLERRRHACLAEVFDPQSRRVLERLGVGTGWRCLEVGAGGGSVARWLASKVAPDGHILATDVDMRFLDGIDEPNLEVRRHDIVNDSLPDDAFDLVHARGVLEHLPARDEAVARMVAATRPGGWVVLEDADWTGFAEQQLPDAFRALYDAVHAAYALVGYEPFFGRRLLHALRGAGLVDVCSEGQVFTMYGGTPSTEWYALAIERAGPQLTEAGIASAELVARALAALRDPAFAVLSPAAMAAWGRRPA